MTQKPRQARDELAISALAAGCTNAEAARRSGHSRATIVRRLRDETFVAAVRAERSAMLERASAGLMDASAKAVAALNGLLDDESPQIRLTAARCVLEQVTRLRDSTELAERIARLESKIEGGER